MFIKKIKRVNNKRTLRVRRTHAHTQLRAQIHDINTTHGVQSDV
jgi:hypothetical protein